MEKKQINRLFCLLIMTFITSCCPKAKYQLMNHKTFTSIPTGSCFKNVTKEFGPPYDVVLLKDGIKEYRYIQRTQIAPGVMEYVYFIVTVSYEGYIINKTVDKVTGTSELCSF